MMPMLRAAATNAETRERASDFVRLAACKALRLSPREAEDLCASPRVVEILKSPIGAGVTSADKIYGSMVSAFLISLRAISVFERIASEAALRLSTVRPLVFGIFSQAVTAGAATEGAARSVRVLGVGNTNLTPATAESTVVVSRDLIAALDAEGLNALNRELSGAVALACDAAAATALASVNSSEAISNGSSFSAMLVDLERLLHAVPIALDSKPFFVMPQPQVKSLAAAAASAGIGSVGPLGGSILGVEILVSDAWPLRTISLVDASRVIAASEPLMLSQADQATLQMDSSPTNASGPSVTATSLVSMWQTNSVALRAYREIALNPLDNSVASISNIEWPNTDSPTGF